MCLFYLCCTYGCVWCVCVCVYDEHAYVGVFVGGALCGCLWVVRCVCVYDEHVRACVCGWRALCCVCVYDEHVCVRE